MPNGATPTEIAERAARAHLPATDDTTPHPANPTGRPRRALRANFVRSVTVFPVTGVTDSRFRRHDRDLV